LPVIFICNGIFLILVLANIINLKKNKWFFVIISSLYFISFFVGNVNFFDIYINIFQVIAISILLVYFNSYSHFKIFNFLYALVTMFIVYYSFELYHDFIYNNYYILVLTFSILPLLILNNKFDRCLVILNTSILLSFVLVSFEMNEFTFATMNFNLVFEMLLISYIISIIQCSIMKVVDSEKNKFNTFNTSYDAADGFCL